MFEFTLVQSRTYADTVLNVFPGLELRHEGVKPYVCSECPKRFYIRNSELKTHQLVHSNYKQFCCFLCDKSFKRKYHVVKHFKRCSVVRGFVHI